MRPLFPEDAAHAMSNTVRLGTTTRPDLGRERAGVQPGVDKDAARLCGEDCKGVPLLAACVILLGSSHCEYALPSIFPFLQPHHKISMCPCWVVHVKNVCMYRFWLESKGLGSITRLPVLRFCLVRPQAQCSIAAQCDRCD